MLSQSALKKLKALTRKSLDAHDIAKSLSSVRQLDDRSAAIIAASHLDFSLHHLTTLSLPYCDELVYENLLAPYKPLSDFYSRVWLAYSLKLYGPKTRDDLEIIRNIRNTFAHAPGHIDFEMAEVVEAVEKITLPARASNVDIDQVLGPDMWPPKTTRDIFIETSFAYWSAFMELCGRHPQPWPLD